VFLLEGSQGWRHIRHSLFSTLQKGEDALFPGACGIGAVDLWSFPGICARDTSPILLQRHSSVVLVCPGDNLLQCKLLCRKPLPVDFQRGLPPPDVRPPLALLRPNASTPHTYTVAASLAVPSRPVVVWGRA